MSATATTITPDRIMQLGFAYWGSRTLLSAVELGVFTELAAGPLNAETLRQRLGLHQRSARDFFDALVALGMLDREGEEYRNTPETSVFLDRDTASYGGGLPRDVRRPALWLLGFPDGGAPHRPAAERGEDRRQFLRRALPGPVRLKGFARAMTGISMGAAQAIARQFPWEKHRTFVDLGAAEGCLPVQVALAHPHLTGVGFDLPPLGPIFDEYVASFGLQDRLRFHGGDFLADPLPERGRARAGASAARLERGRAARAARQGLPGAPRAER